MEMFLVSGNSVYYGIAAPVILCGMCSYIPKLRQISVYCKPENFCSTYGTVESINWMCVSCNYNLFSFKKRSQQASSIAQTFSSQFSKRISRDERVRPVRLSKVTYYCEWETSLAMIEGKWEKWFKYKLFRLKKLWLSLCPTINHTSLIAGHRLANKTISSIFETLLARWWPTHHYAQP